MKIINVILSGGVGSRLWPLSRKSKPKQYLPIFDGRTLFEKTVERNLHYCNSIIIVGNKENYQLSREKLEQLGITHYGEIIEACPRNTAAAIAFAAFSVSPEDLLLISPSDHLIENDHFYQDSILRGIDLAKNGFMVTFGLKPKNPETGFGYIESDGEEVLGFREKPDLKTAEFFFNSNNFLWNSGMFCFKAGIYLEELEKLHPEVYITSLLAFNSKSDGFLDLENSLKIPSISIDYAVMEKTKNIKVVKSEFQWSDMGSFESLYDYLSSIGHPIDENGNMVIGTDIHTEFVGLKNTILINSPDALLILQKSMAQEVKGVYNRIEITKPELI
jgi:mannose-1-phosphate guanylyltransferase